MSGSLRLISHKLCPYVQRAVIALTEKGVAFERIDVDLANKPDWFSERLAARPDARACRSAIPRFSNPRSFSNISRRPNQSRCIRLTRCVAPNIAAGSNLALLCSTILPGSIRRPMKPRSRPRRRNSKRALCGLKTVSRLRRGSMARRFRSSMRSLGRCFVISMCSTKSANSAFWPASRSLRVGAQSLAARPSVKSAVSTEYPALLRDFLKRRNSWISQLQTLAAA